MITIIPSNTEVLAAATQAAAAGLLLITNGERACISPVCPPGWTRLSVHCKQPQEPSHESR